MEVEVDVKPRGVTTREGGERVRGEPGFLWRKEDGLEVVGLNVCQRRNGFLVVQEMTSGWGIRRV